MPDQATKDRILARAAEVYGAGKFIDDIKMGGVSAPGWLDAVLALLPATKGVASGGLATENGAIQLSGEVPSQEAKDKAYLDAVAAAPGVIITNLLTAPGQAALSADQARTQTTLDAALSGKTIEFEAASARLTPQGQAVLDELTPVLKASADKVAIGGHTDADGPDAANQALSERRAQAVRDYLASKGLDAARFSAVGHGEAKPIADNTTPQGKQRNRRIEFQLVGGQ